MKRVLLTGRNGQVGWELERTLAPLGEVFAFDRAGLDLTNADRIRELIRQIKPDIIVNPAAYTAVDLAESEVAQAMAINADAPGVMAEEARRLGALLVHYSTDYVFDGTKEDPYTEDDSTSPINAYGRSKLAGEQAIQAAGCRHLIFRTSWVYGLRGRNFLRTIQRLAAEREELRIVDDQIGAPTWSRMIAEATALAIMHPSQPLGLFNLAAGGETSWHGFARQIVAHACANEKREPRLVPIPSDEYPVPAARPKNSRLDSRRLADETGIRLPKWDESLRLCLAG